MLCLFAKKNKQNTNTYTRTRTHIPTFPDRGFRRFSTTTIIAHLCVDLLAPLHPPGQLGVPLVEGERGHVLLLPSLHARLNRRAVDLAPHHDRVIRPFSHFVSGQARVEEGHRQRARQSQACVTTRNNRHTGSVEKMRSTTHARRALVRSCPGYKLYAQVLANNQPPITFILQQWLTMPRGQRSQPWTVRVTVPTYAHLNSRTATDASVNVSGRRQ